MNKKKYNPPQKLSLNANYKSLKDYSEEHKRSLKENDVFWSEKAERIEWFKKWKKVSDIDFTLPKIEWFIGGKLNVSYNCIDRHIKNGKGDAIAFYWEGNDPSESKKLTYNQLYDKVCRFSNVLKNLNISKGDRVCLYMQMIPELPIAMLSCARIGAVHSVVFGAFSSDSLRDRINDSKCKLLITQDTGVRGTKNNIPMKSNADVAIEQSPSIENTIVVMRTGEKVHMKNKRDHWWHEQIDSVKPHCEPEHMFSKFIFTLLPIIRIIPYMLYINITRHSNTT